MKKSLSLNIEMLTRVEGHGHIVIDVAGGELRKAELQIVEAPRFFEAMLRGRSIFEAQHITSRICGICACGHSLASIQAAEEALGFIPTEQTVRLRELLLHMEILDSHLLHINMLALPDLLGAKSFMGLVPEHEETVRRALRMKKLCNDVCDILTGRHVHPITCVVGGFTRLPDAAQLERMRELLCRLREELEPTVALLAGLNFPEFERETEYVALVSETSEYPFFSSTVGSSDGVLRDKRDYRAITNEFPVAHSSAKHARLSRDSYAVGALARFNLNSAKLHPAAREVARRLGLSIPCHNPYLNTAAQLVECVHCAEEALAGVGHLQETGIDSSEAVVVGVNENSAIPVRPGRGVGAVEVPRGLLFHSYSIDARGLIQEADCVIPTAQNLRNIENDMRKLVPEILAAGESEIGRALEMLVRAYDPCISCSTHLLKIDLIRPSTHC